jgi:antitoxin component YwqK of YwqJK toxin-antitoxin module
MPSARAYYDNGKLTGPFISYNEGGVVVQIIHYKSDQKDGPSITYYPSGSVLERGDYCVDQKDGIWYRYHENGMVMEVSHWQIGHLLGPVPLYDPDGKQIR